MLQLRSIAIELTPRCNQHCVYCYNPWRSSPADQADELNTADIRSLVDRILDQATVARFTLTGGEPLMREDLLPIIDHINARGLPVAIISNGGLIDQHAAEQLAARNVHYVQVTLGGPEEQLHDAICGDGSFRRTTRGVVRLVGQGVAVGGSFLCTRNSYASAADTLERMLSLGIRHHYAFNRFNPSGCGAEHLYALMPTRSHVLTALAQANQFAESHDVQISCTMPIPPCMLDQRDYPRVRFGACSAGMDRGELAVDPHGRLKLCTLQQRTLGSVAEHSLEELVTGPVATAFRTKIPVFCVPCPHRTSCLGGCGAAAEWVLGQPYELDPFLAQHVMPDFASRMKRGRA
jgi:radical SAM protein with 4Fe4S-binding SPASM domain